MTGVQDPCVQPVGLWTAGRARRVARNQQLKERLRAGSGFALDVLLEIEPATNPSALLLCTLPRHATTVGVSR